MLEELFERMIEAGRSRTRASMDTKAVGESESFEGATQSQQVRRLRHELNRIRGEMSERDAMLRKVVLFLSALNTHSHGPDGKPMIRFDLLPSFTENVEKDAVSGEKSERSHRNWNPEKDWV
jgi:hypothetical protein